MASRAKSNTGDAAPIIVPQQIQHWPIEKLRPYDRNPRTHSRAQVQKIAKSIREYGFTNPILVASDAGIIAGHGRLEAAKLLGLTSVPVIELSHLSPAQRRAYVLADNRLAMDAGWDEELLGEELLALQDEGFDLDLTGFDPAELMGLLGQTEAEEVPAPPVPENPVSRVGDLWILGEHRLLCGDATSAADVERVLAGAAPRLLLTDPPYGISLDMEWRDRAGHNTLGAAEPSYMKTENHRNRSISGDTRADWSDAFELVPSLDTAYVWHASTFAPEVALGLKRIGFEIKQQIIWRKSQFVLSRSHYHWQHEPCWYARKPGSQAFRGSKDQSTVWDAPSPKMLMTSRDEEPVDHPTQKAIVLFTRPIENHTKRNEWVYEPFGGSGTTLIAAEQTGRRCIAIEIDPKYVDVIALRWMSATGKVAMLDSGETFDDVKAARGSDADAAS
ncbi:MAG: site-specific DNA-methyltransferase [bacterium]